MSVSELKIDSMSKKFRIMDPSESREVIMTQRKPEDDPGRQTFHVTKASLSTPASLPLDAAEAARSKSNKYILSTQTFSTETPLIARKTVIQQQQDTPHDTKSKKYRLLTTEERQVIANTPKRDSSVKFRPASARTQSLYKTAYSLVGNIETIATQDLQSPKGSSSGATRTPRTAGVIVEHSTPLNYHVAAEQQEPQYFRGLSIPYGSRTTALTAGCTVEPVSHICSVSPAVIENNTLHLTSHLYRQNSTNRALGDATATYVGNLSGSTALAKGAAPAGDYALSFQRSKHSVSTQRSTSTKSQPDKSDAGVPGAASNNSAGPFGSSSGGASGPGSAVVSLKAASRPQSGSVKAKPVAPMSLTTSLTLGDGAIASSTLAASQRGAIPESDDAPITTISYQTKLQNPYAPQQRTAGQTGELLNMANGTVIATYTETGDAIENFSSDSRSPALVKKRCLPTYNYVELLKSQRTLEFVPSPPDSPKPGEANPREVTDIIYTGPSLYSQYLASQVGSGGIRAGAREKSLLQNLKVQADVLRRLKKKNADIRKNTNDLAISLNFFND